ncbi:superoxide dismutase, Cu-Zn family [Paenibacillus sp. UNCCL117]|uniref:superoxide dismutase family protein n=1 Tax=unclassified Paenibacillus TaxID=185978 RepID=UPI0008814B47|nr:MULTISPECIES: superoxide dismutase family protein [unclassified Paenibacillus]SDE66070.1 superoxide dismutase, Cu-Zn family [Paenibacillus sp. cl123]SFW70331.1 superoxide dismutase, Cu-Zn family [Paenibacillus sp. UNCCL117]
MTRKKMPVSTAAGAFLCGALFFSGLGYAASTHIEVSLEKLSFYVKGKHVENADGAYSNNGTVVPEAFIYQGTTYVTLRQASELVGQSLYWDGLSRSVSVGHPTVVMYSAKGEVVGRAELIPQEDGVKVTLEVEGLAPGTHGFHIHEKPFANMDLATAGGHFNPDGKQHGHDNAAGAHLGDLPNLQVGADGKGRVEYVIRGASLDGGHYSILGRSLIIHAAADDGKTDPAGNSGERIAGGLIPR